MEKEYVPTIDEKIEDFFDVVDSLRYIYYENIRLKQENAKLKKESQERFEQIMKMSEMSQEGLDNWIKLICKGKIKINDK